MNRDQHYEIRRYFWELATQGIRRRERGEEPTFEQVNAIRELDVEVASAIFPQSAKFIRSIHNKNDAN